MNRRAFLLKAGSLGILAGISALPFEAFAATDLLQLTVLHTNDTHSRIDPFPLNDSKFPGMGGVASRKTLIEKVRTEGHPVLLLDAGDYFQGTPYFNFFKGEIEIRSMNELRYDAAAIGNHDFDAGIERLAEMARLADFPILCHNLEFADTPLAGIPRSWKVFQKNGLKIGVFGLSMQLSGLVSEKLYGNTLFHEPLKRAQEAADFLRLEKDCDLVICLSHLGYFSKFPGQMNDELLAKNTSGIDLIIGGHTHDFLDNPVYFSNTKNIPVGVCQVGHSGVKLGRIDFWFDRERRKLKKRKGGVLTIA